MTNLKIYLSWVDINEEHHIEEMDYSLKPCSIITYEEIVKNNEILIEFNIRDFGLNQWLWKYNPYTSITILSGGKIYRRWTLEKYLKERRKR